ncbi:hypothetical protein LTR85_010165 [Meristemomyces frigidus]|nr:hypothetical protein LTR85_010165 [Meristemomyces frigidus]
MDSLRLKVSKTTASLKASQFRLNAAAASLVTSQQVFSAAIADVKSGNCADAKERANEAATATKDAQAKLNEAKAEVEAREVEADKAKAAYNGHNSTHPRRNARMPMDHAFFAAKAPIQDESDANPEQPLDAITVNAYHTATKVAFSDYSALTAFPSPPAALCSKPSCLQSKKERVLEACPCNIRDTFSGLNGKEFKQAKMNFLSDRFRKAPEAIRADCQAKAKEVYAVLDAMSQASRSDGKQQGHNKRDFQQVRKKGGNY